MSTNLSETARHCAYCGHPIAAGLGPPERFGEVFCSGAHADEFAEGVCAARIEAAARADTTAIQETKAAGGCALPRAGEGGWTAYLKRAACWGAPLLLLLAIPLMWSGGWAGAGGSLLSVVALLACPLGMYFMMRGMMSMQQQQGDTDRHPDGDTSVEPGKERRRA